MADTAKRTRPERRQARNGWRWLPSPPPSVGLSLLTTPAPVAAPDPPATDVAWTRSARGLARIAIWALPAYAVTLGVLPVIGGRGPQPGTDPVGWAQYVTGPWYWQVHLLAGLGGALLGLVAVVALTALLATARSRRTALTGLLVGLAAAVGYLPQLGLSTFAAPPSATAVLGGDLTAAHLYAQAHGGGPALAAAALHTLAWLLLGLAVWRSRVLNRGDGALLMLAAPLVGVAGLGLWVLVTVGAVLLLAAGIGIGWHAGRLAGLRR